PQLSAARRIAQRVYCNANIRSMLQAMANYGTGNDDAIVGSPNTSGVYLKDVNASIYPGPCCTRWDFMGPIALDSGMQEVMDEDPRNPFNIIRSMKHFQCPSNQFLAPAFTASGGLEAGSGPMISYNTGRNFMTLGRPAIVKEADGSNPAVIADDPKF